MRVVFAAIAPCAAHVLNLGFIEVGKPVLFLLRAEAEIVPREGRVVVEGAVLRLRSRPGLPPVGLLQEVGVSKLPQRPPEPAAEG